ncbi:MAG: urease accessory protein [Spirosomataceae bacterium]
MELAPLLIASVVGFTHAFEADHLVAVSNIVIRRSNVMMAIKDGIFWGLGHTSTILVVGSVILLGRISFQETDFRYFEAGVGCMLILLGGFRLSRLLQKQPAHAHPHVHANDFSLAYGVGLIHGLAGSGALMLSVMATIQGTLSSLVYLFVFGIGSIAGMMLAAGLFSVPFSERLLKHRSTRKILTLLSSVLCVVVGCMILYKNLLS